MMGGKLHGKWRLPTALSGSDFAAEKRDPGYGSRRQHLRVLRRQGAQVADVDCG